MKRFSITLLAAIAFIAATLKASAQETQTRQVSGFNGIASSVSANIHVKIDGNESLKITADKAVLDRIETVVENNKLQIKFKKSNDWNENHDKIEIEISAKALSSLSLAGSGKFIVDGSLTGDDVKVSIAGSGNMLTGVKADKFTASIAGSGSYTITGTAKDAHFSISGSGSLKASDLKTDNANVSIGGFRLRTH